MIRRLTHRNASIATGFAVVAFAALLIAGLAPRAVRTYALDAPDSLQVAVLHPGEASCEGPIVSPSVTSVGLFGAADAKGSTITVRVERASDRRVLSEGQLNPGTRNTEWVVPLNRSVGHATPVRVCVADARGSFALWGSGSQHADIVSTGRGAGLEFSLVLFDDRRSFLGSLGLAFSRAALWRFSWAGSWMYWLLTVALLGTLAIGVAAVTSAAADDEDVDHDEGPSPESGTPPPPPPTTRSEGGQDRPQPVC